MLIVYLELTQPPCDQHPIMEGLTRVFGEADKHMLVVWIEVILSKQPTNTAFFYIFFLNFIELCTHTTTSHIMN
jgi:hypothetical protein